MSGGGREGPVGTQARGVDARETDGDAVAAALAQGANAPRSAAGKPGNRLAHARGRRLSHARHEYRHIRIAAGEIESPRAGVRVRDRAGEAHRVPGDDADKTSALGIGERERVVAGLPRAQCDEARAVPRATVYR